MSWVSVRSIGQITVLAIAAMCCHSAFAQEIRDRKLGWVCSHETSAVMDAITDALKNPAKRESMTRNARLVFEARYSRTIAMQSWERVLNARLGASISGKAKAEARSA